MADSCCIILECFQFQTNRKHSTLTKQISICPRTWGWGSSDYSSFRDSKLSRCKWLYPGDHSIHDYNIFRFHGHMTSGRRYAREISQTAFIVRQNQAMWPPQMKEARKYLQFHVSPAEVGKQKLDWRVSILVNIQWLPPGPSFIT